MSCFFCDGPRVMSTYDAPHNGCQSVPIGTMTLMRGCDGEPMVKVELDTEIELSVSADGAGYGTTDVSVRAAGYIKHIRFCPFCGRKLGEG